MAERDYATTIVRNFLYCSFALRLWTALQSAADAQLAAIAGRAVKETRYHLRHARDWLVRLGDGTDESHERAQASLDHLMPCTQEFWSEWEAPAIAASNATGVSPIAWRQAWDAEVDAALAEATLRRPAAAGLRAARQGGPALRAPGLPARRDAESRARASGSDLVNSVEQAWQALEAIPDPEIPVVSIRELGILREITERDGQLQVVITPTYSGCPAMAQIEDDVRTALAGHELRAQVITRLSPAWTTDWITAAAREKLRGFGIAPPQAAGAPNVVHFARPVAALAVACPHCSSTNTTETSHFGSTACKALFKCLDCLEPFDYFKPY